MSALLDVANLGVSQQGRPVLSGVSFNAGPGERIAVIGPNGAGKSTLLRAIAGLIPSSGAIEIDGVARHDTVARARALSYLPQDRSFHWPVKVCEIVALGRVPHGWRGDPFNAADSAAIARAMADVEITDFAERNIDRLSGGERARVALARAIAVEASIILADEPVAALDPRHQLATLAALTRRATTGLLTLAVLHDLTLAARWATRILLLDAGRLVADGAAETVLTARRLEQIYHVRFEIGADAGGMTVLARQAIVM